MQREKISCEAQVNMVRLTTIFYFLVRTFLKYLILTSNSSTKFLSAWKEQKEQGWEVGCKGLGSKDHVLIFFNITFQQTRKCSSLGDENVYHTNTEMTIDCSRNKTQNMEEILLAFK